MEIIVKNEVNTPEARDAQRLKALPIILAVELAHHREYLQSHDLISHDELEDAVRHTLGLELAESANNLFEEINSYMCEWHWQWLTFDCMTQHFYAQPEKQRANIAVLAGRRFVLQPDEVFPDDLDDVSNCLLEADFTATTDTGHENDRSCNIAENADDDALFKDFAEKFLINPLGSYSL